MKKREGKEKVVGVDVGKTELVVCFWDENKTHKYPNTQKGVLRLVKKIAKRAPELVVCEHTGKCERLFVRELWKQGIGVHVAHPHAARCFAGVVSQAAKTDPLDASLLMKFGQMIPLPLTPAPEETTVEMQELTARRGDLMQILVQEKNRRVAPQVSEVSKESIGRLTKAVEAEIKEIESRMKLLAQGCEKLQKKIACLQEEVGMGFLSSFQILALVPELGTMNRQRVASLFGVAPFDDQSGSRIGKQLIKGGRKASRTALYMAALSVTHAKEHPLKDFYLRLVVQEKKPKKIAIIAVMRKLAIRLNTKLKQFAPQLPVAA
jgi:transposase